MPIYHLETVIAELQRQTAALRAALQFYADERTYCASWDRSMLAAPILIDHGQKARQALGIVDEMEPEPHE